MPPSRKNSLPLLLSRIIYVQDNMPSISFFTVFRFDLSTCLRWDVSLIAPGRSCLFMGKQLAIFHSLLGIRIIVETVRL